MSWQGSASHHKKRLAAGRLQISFLRLKFATFKFLFLLSLKIVAKITLCATSGKKIGGRSFCLVFDDLRNLESLANAMACF